MSFEKLRIPGLSDEETIDLNLLLEQLDKKRIRNELRSAYYDGKRVIRQVGLTIPSQYNRLALALGWTAKGVDGLSRRCNIDRFVWTGGDLDSLGMDELQDSNFLLSELSQGRTDSLIHGISYLITTQGVEGEPKALVHAKDALNATGTWNDRKRELDNLLSITSRKDNRVTGFVMYAPGETISAEKSDGKWEIVDRSAHPWGVPADPLVYKPRSSRRMGRSRITRPAMGFQDAAIRALVRLEAHMDIYAVPQLILLGASDRIFKNADGSYKAAWQVAFGRALGIPDADPEDKAENPRADVKQFASASPEPHLADLNVLAKLTARELDMSDSDFALTDLANPTAADSYSEARENLISEAEGANDDWTTPIRRSVTRALAIQNDLDEIPEDWRSIQPKWRSPMHVSKAAAADAGAKQIASVPWLAETEVGLELLGLDEQQVSRAMAEKRRAQGRALVAALNPQGNANGA